MIVQLKIWQIGGEVIGSSWKEVKCSLFNYAKLDMCFGHQNRESGVPGVKSGLNIYIHIMDMYK